MKGDHVVIRAPGNGCGGGRCPAVGKEGEIIIDMAGCCIVCFDHPGGACNHQCLFPLSAIEEWRHHL